VLEIGAGSGFMAALLAHRAQRVVSLESRPALARMATENLRRAGIANAEVRQADGSRPLDGLGPVDVIVLSGSVSSVPADLLALLKVGGRLVAIEGAEPVMRAMLHTRQSADAVSSSVLFDTVAPRLDGFAEPSRFHF